MIRSYTDKDYDQLKALYEMSELFGGVFDEARDGRERLKAKIADDPDAILVSEEDGSLNGTVSLIEDGRVAGLYRFAVYDHDSRVAKELYDAAAEILKLRGHKELQVFTSLGSHNLNDRYAKLGMNKGSTYVTYWNKL